MKLKSFENLTKKEMILKLGIMGFGVLLFLLGFIFLFGHSTVSNVTEIHEKAELSSLVGKRVMLSGLLVKKSEAEDPDFQLRSDGVALQRTVEMVQYRLTDGKAEPVFSTEPLPDFTLDDETYENPEMPENLKTELFTSSLQVSDIPIDPSFLERLIAKNGENEYVYTVMKELPENETAFKKFNLRNEVNYYATPGNRFQVGDLRITFRELILEEPFYVTVVGTAGEDGIIPFDKNDCIFDEAMSFSDLRERSHGVNLPLAIIFMAFGVSSAAVGIWLRKK